MVGDLGSTRDIGKSKILLLLQDPTTNPLSSRLVVRRARRVGTAESTVAAPSTWEKLYPSCPGANNEESIIRYLG